MTIPGFNTLPRASSMARMLANGEWGVVGDNDMAGGLPSAKRLLSLLLLIE